MTSDSEQIILALRKSMLSKSHEIWDKSASAHAEDLAKVVQATTSIAEWRKVSLDRYGESAMLINESILDLFGSINSIMSGFYRQGMISLRSFLEMILATVYYADHYLEYKKWRATTGTENETKLGKWLNEGFLSLQYMSFFVPEENICQPQNKKQGLQETNGRSELSNRVNLLYGNLSKFVHAQKDETMQFTNNSLKIRYDAHKFGTWRSKFLEAVVLSHLILSVRFWNDLQSSPGLKKRVLEMVPMENKVILL